MRILSNFKKVILSCFSAMTAITSTFAGENFSGWSIAFDKGFSFEDARLFSLPGNDLKNGQTLLLSSDNMADLGKLAPGFIPAESKAVVRGIYNAPKAGKLVIAVGADWWFHGFINGVPFGDTEATGNRSYPISALDQFYLVDVKEGENIISFHLRAGNNWHFGVTLLPMPENLPGNYRVMQRFVETILEKNFRMERDPLVFNLSTDQASVAVEFSIPALCGIRYTPACGGNTVTRWSSIYGQRERRNIHHFDLTGLSGNTAYNYDILIQNEALGVEKVIYSGKFTTLSATAATHRFTVFSDVQVPTAAKRQAIMDFVRNTSVKQADFVVALGDMASAFGNFAKEYFTDFTDILRAEGVVSPVAFVRGNHELWGLESDLYTRYLGRPYGAFTCGDTFYIRLDCGEDQPRRLTPYNVTQRSDMAEFFAEEAAWLAKVVASPECQNAKRRIILAHTTPFEANNSHMAQNLYNMLADLFYGENPVCKIDLWIAGHIHHPLRYDPIAGELYGLLPPGAKLSLTENDIKNIHFPVYTNDGPRNGGFDLSVLDVTCRTGDIQVRFCLPDGQVADEVLIAPGKKFEVKNTVFKLLWKK